MSATDYLVCSHLYVQVVYFIRNWMTRNALVTRDHSNMILRFLRNGLFITSTENSRVHMTLIGNVDIEPNKVCKYVLLLFCILLSQLLS
jgi:hypothetical protein